MWKKRWLSRSGWLAAAILASIAAEIWGIFESMLPQFHGMQTGGGLPIFGGITHYIRLFIADGPLWLALWNTLFIGPLLILPGLIVGWLAADAAVRRPGRARFLSVAAIVLGCGFMLLQWWRFHCNFIYLYLFPHHRYRLLLSAVLSFAVVFPVTAAMEAAALRLPEEQGGLKNLLRAASTTVAVLAAQFAFSWHGVEPTDFVLPRLIIVGIIVLLVGLLKEAKRRRKRKRPAA